MCQGRSLDEVGIGGLLSLLAVAWCLTLHRSLWKKTDIQRSYPGQGVGIPWAHRTRGDIFPNNNFWTLAGASPKSALTAKHPSLWGVPCPSLTHTKERGEKGSKEKH